jgi:hypothetical protein
MSAAASGSKRWPVRAVCWLSSSTTSAAEKAPSEVASAVMLKGEVVPSQDKVQHPDHGAERPLRIRLLPCLLDVDPDRPEALACVVMVGEPLGRGGLARLPAGLEGEVLAVVDELHHPAEPPLRREHVVLVREAGARGVERGSHAASVPRP